MSAQDQRAIVDAKVAKKKAQKRAAAATANDGLRKVIAKGNAAFIKLLKDQVTLAAGVPAAVESVRSLIRQELELSSQESATRRLGTIRNALSVNDETIDDLARDAVPSSLSLQAIQVFGALTRKAAKTSIAKYVGISVLAVALIAMETYLLDDLFANVATPFSDTPFPVWEISLSFGALVLTAMWARSSAKVKAFREALTPLGKAQAALHRGSIDMTLRFPPLKEAVNARNTWMLLTLSVQGALVVARLNDARQAASDQALLQSLLLSMAVLVGTYTMKVIEENATDAWGALLSGFRENVQNYTHMVRARNNLEASSTETMAEEFAQMLVFIEQVIRPGLGTDPDWAEVVDRLHAEAQAALVDAERALMTVRNSNLPDLRDLLALDSVLDTKSLPKIAIMDTFGRTLSTEEDRGSGNLKGVA